ncbi:MAG: hypothetical protein ACD_51C00260G0001, partial [uncultured bacterium]
SNTRSILQPFIADKHVTRLSLRGSRLFLFLGGRRFLFLLFIIVVKRALNLIFLALDDQVEIAVVFKGILKGNCKALLKAVEPIIFALIGNGHIVFRGIYYLERTTTITAAS